MRPMSSRVRVPCSTSNLGPGFDLLGLALELALDLTCELTEGGAPGPLEVAARKGWAAGWPQDDDLVRRAFRTVFEARGLTPPAARFTADSKIPVARGLGSSGAAVAGGLLLANHALRALGHAPLEAATLHALGIRLEGHPDNVTASLFGGCTLCLPPNDTDAPEGALVQHPVAESIGFAVVWGAATTTTEAARAVLPPKVAFADAVENPRRLALLLEGLRTGAPELLRLGVHDRLHHAARLALIPGGAEALAAAEAAGAWATAINGSGASLLALGPVDGMQPIAAALGRALAEHDADVETHVLDVVRGAPVVAPD